MTLRDTWDVLVVGGGHAGCEAALAAQRMGARTALLTLSREKIATMPCNPAIGGPAKATLVREIDALGGQMGLVTDETRLQIKILNASKGPAVQALRAQSDKSEYAQTMRRVVEAAVTVLELAVRDLQVNKDFIVVLTNGPTLLARAVILTTGTFLGGKCYTGMVATPGGRQGEAPAIGLTAALERLGFQLGRLKTGTPPRLSRRSIDFGGMEVAPGDERPLRFSFLPCHSLRPNVPCHLTYTNERTHELIRQNLHLSPMYGGLIEGVGPRYCPSIEDKVVRFAQRDRHQIFIEPEGMGPELYDWMYVQGFSTSLPAEVQQRLVRTLPGLEQAIVLRPGYAVEYDYVPATQLAATLETLRVPRLFCAGQINGTSGYEEAAAQGLVAGVNAALRARNEEGVVFARSESYIGTLIDDLVLKDIREPYRMLTSRSEWRLLLRGDNADRRLTRLGRRLGLVDDSRWNTFRIREGAIQEALEWLAATRVGPSDRACELLGAFGERLEQGCTLLEVLCRPHIPPDIVWKLGGAPSPASETLEQVAIEVKYAGYLRRQAQDVARLKGMEAAHLPGDLDYQVVGGLSAEARDKLGRIRPGSIGQASRIGGVTPADVSLLAVHLELRRRALG